MKSYFFILIMLALGYGVQAQYWQQRVEYTMDLTLNTKTHTVQGKQKLVYYNNSPDILHQVYYHLYWNAFQPGSMMDIRSQTIADPDGRVVDRIAHLKDDEIGYQQIISLRQNGADVHHTVRGTILEVQLKKPLMPGKKTILDMEFKAQVPLQIRRAGRNNKEGIAYSMTQWYPKMVEYDNQGWSAYPYIGREFHGVWGDYDITIRTDSSFMLAGTGILQKPNKIGYGYEDEGIQVTRNKKETSWHFIAKNVHDFAWAADPDYRHERVNGPNNLVIHLFYQPGEKTDKNWDKLGTYARKHIKYMNDHFGVYPYLSYSIIQGGDGGMEYPMCTLITGERNLESLVGVTLHEMSHSWYQSTLATNEGLYPWMDEGFTSYTSDESMVELFDDIKEDVHQSNYDAYFWLTKRGTQEPLSTHADQYHQNHAYSIASYSMGSIFLHQLRYLIGNKAFYAGMKRYYTRWKMKHPTPNDFIRIMEKTSGIQLHWYLRYWVYTTKTIDYGITTAQDVGQNKARITLKKIGEFPMPLDLLVTYKNGDQEVYYIPMNEMLGSKPHEDSTPRKVFPTWNWVNPNYTLNIPHALSEIKSIEIDPSQRMADVDRTNNRMTWSVEP